MSKSLGDGIRAAERGFGEAEEAADRLLHMIPGGPGDRSGVLLLALARLTAGMGEHAAEFASDCIEQYRMLVRNAGRG